MSKYIIPSNAYLPYQIQNDLFFLNEGLNLSVKKDISDCLISNFFNVLSKAKKV